MCPSASAARGSPLWQALPICLLKSCSASTTSGRRISATKKEIVAKGILLPPNAPREYTDRQMLWNAVEASEKQWNAQLARGIIMALPRELPADQYEALVREYCMEQFVSKGMIADYAIHDND